MNTVTEVAEKLRAIADEITEHPDHWTQGEWARNALNEKADHSGEAVCWCAFGFLDREKLLESGASGYLNEAAYRISPMTGGYIAYNDTPGRTHEEVAALFRKAADIVEEGS